jgi:hypothetical protein
MFIWDFSAIFAVALILTVGLVLALWIRYNFYRDGQQVEGAILEYFRQCSYCGYVYLDYSKKSPCYCPRCLSYHD